jgi:hypothetical protein
MLRGKSKVEVEAGSVTLGTQSAQKSSLKKAFLTP